MTVTTTNDTDKLTKQKTLLTDSTDLVVETPPTTNDSTSTTNPVDQSLLDVAMATTSTTKVNANNESKPLRIQNQKKVISKLNLNRCVVCFKLVKNLKGNKLCQFYDLSAVYPVVAAKSRSFDEFDDTSDLLGEATSSCRSSNCSDINNIDGPLDLNNNNVNSNINSKNSLVKESVDEEEEEVETSNQVINNKSQLYENNNCSNKGRNFKTTKTIGDVVNENVKLERRQLLDKNSSCLKKICEGCYRHVCLIEYHIKSAGQIMDLVGLKLKRSNNLLTSAGGLSDARMTKRALSACSSKVASAESLIGDGVSGDLVDLLNSQNETRLFNKRKAIDARNSSQNMLTKVAKNESSLTNNGTGSGNCHSSANNKIPINNFINIASNFKANSTIFEQQQRLRTISHIENLLRENADPQTLSQMQRLAQSASLLQNGFAKQANSMNLNHNFKSINNSNHSNNNTNVSSFTAFNVANNKSVNFNKNALNQETKTSRNDLSDVSESSYKSNQFEQKQQEQGSRRKRKSINPSRLMKDNLTNDLDANNKTNTQIPNNIGDPASQSELKQATGYAKKGGLLQNGGHQSAFERRHHSADSFPHQHAKLVNTNSSQKQASTTGFKATSHIVQGNGKGNTTRHSNHGYNSGVNRVKKAQIEYDSQLQDSIDQSARALLLLSEKENDKLDGLLFNSIKHEEELNGNKSDGCAGQNDFIEQNGINCDVDEEDANEHLMNESGHDLSEVSNVGGGYILDEDEDENHLTMDPDETDNEIDIDIDEVEADAEDDDELDENEQDTEDEEDCGSVENDENHLYQNGYGNKNIGSNHKQNSSYLKRQKLDLTNGSTRNNKLTKKIFNIKNELYKNNNNKNSSANMLNKQNNIEFNQQRHTHSGKNFGFNHKGQSEQARVSKNGHGGMNAVKGSKKFNVKSESTVRNNSHTNGNYYVTGNPMNYDEGSNHSKSNPNFVSPSLSDSPSPSQMADITSPHSRSLNSSYLGSGGGSNGSTKHACEVCKKTFKTQNILRQHMRIHTGDKPFVCDICTKAFSQMASLKYHLATHSDARPYRCEVCSKTFKLKPPFKKHIKECQPKLGATGQGYQHQQASSPSGGSQFNYFNSGQFNVNSNGLELEANEDDID